MGARLVHGDPATVAGADPDARAAWREPDVVREERRCDVAGESRPRRLGEVEHGDPLRLRPERRPQCVGESGHVPRRPADVGPVHDPVASKVHDGDLAALRIGDVCDASVPAGGRVARLPEPA